MLQASTAVQYFSLTWLILLYSQQGERKHVSFANPSTLQKHSAGKNQSIGILSFRMLLKTVITWLCFCLFSSPNCSRVATERKKRWFSYTARYSGTLLSPLHGGRSTKSPTNDLQIISIFYQAFSEFSLCFSCHKKHRTVKRIVLDSSKTCWSPMQARPCKRAFRKQLPNQDTRLLPHIWARFISSTYKLNVLPSDTRGIHAFFKRRGKI